MIRSLVFTTQGRLHSRNIEMFLMPTLLSDTNLFLWVDLENPTPEETKYVLEDVFHFHPLSIEDCVMASPSNAGTPGSKPLLKCFMSQVCDSPTRFKTNGWPSVIQSHT